MRVLPIWFAVPFALASCATIHPSGIYIDGQRKSISEADVASILALSRHYIATESQFKGSIYLLHIAGSDKVQVHFGEHLGAGAIAADSYLELERQHTTWKVTDNYLSW
jgi:hypothetical protein